MLTRRELLASAGVAPALRPAAAAAAHDEAEVQRISTELRELRGEWTTVGGPAWGAVAGIRERQRLFFKQHLRFPQRIDIGLRVWERMQDWHITHGRELRVGRSSEGLLEMEFLFSTLVLRPELGENDIGTAYDK
jgi:hypothetical protein